jgi:hypothetical protein
MVVVGAVLVVMLVDAVVGTVVTVDWTVLAMEPEVCVIVTVKPPEENAYGTPF